MDKFERRNSLLKILYENNQNNPGTKLSARKIANTTSIPFKDVCADFLYWKGKDYVEIEEEREIGRAGLLNLQMEITTKGIDYIEAGHYKAEKKVMPDDEEGFEFDVALSFAGEDRVYVEQVADYLKGRGANVFYDRYEKAVLWGKDLYVHLDEIYRKRAKYCVMFLSQYYASKLWTNHERQSAQARAFEERREYILPVRFDDTEIPGIRPTVGYIDLRRTFPEELGNLILEKLGRITHQDLGEQKSAFRIPKRTKPRPFNPYEEAQHIVDFIVLEIRNRCTSLSSQGISLSVLNRNGRMCLRIVNNGETRYSLDVWIGGISGDSSLSFYGIQGEMSNFSSNTSNAWADVTWSDERDSIVIKLTDMSLLDMLGESRELTKEEFVDALWNKICDAIESKD
ncbi:toll/interleukin-1 receptor domain-containing protein [Candidatus Omnitrophota bacterium]